MCVCVCVCVCYKMNLSANEFGILDFIFYDFALHLCQTL